MTSPPDGTPAGRSLIPPGMLANIGSAVLPLVGSLVVSLLLAPYLGDAGFGQYMTVISAATLLLIGGKFGIHAATSRLLTEHPDGSGVWLRAGLWLRLGFTAGFALLGLALVPVFSESLSAGGASRLVAPVVVTASLFEFAGEALVGLRRFGHLLLTRVGALVLRVAAVVWVRVAGLDAVAFLAGHALSQLLPAVVVLGGLLRALPRGQTPAREALHRTFSISVPLALSSASFLVFSHTDRLMLAWFHDAAAVGQFGVARSVLDASLFPIYALTWSVRPALVRAVTHGTPEDRQHALAQGLRWSFLFAALAPVAMGLLGPPLLVLLYTATYAEAARLLLWMLPILVLRGVGAVVFPALLATDRQALYAKLMAWTAAVNVIANLALIPALGARGAVLGTLAALLPLTVLGLVQVRRALGPLPWRQVF